MYAKRTLIFCLLSFMALLSAAAPAVDLAEGLVAEWTFEEGEGEVVRDTSDNNHNGTLHSGPQWVKEGIGTALKFDGVDDYVDCGAGAGLDITEQISLEAWVRPEKPSLGEPLIVGKGIYSYGLTWTGTRLMFYITAGHLKCHAELPLRQWSHVVGVYDGKRMRLYVNGTLFSGFVMPEPGTKIKSRGTSVLMGRQGRRNTGGFFCGMLDNVRVYDRPLSDREVREHYAVESKLVQRPPPVPRDQIKGLALRVHDAGTGYGELLISGHETVPSDLTVPRGLCLRFTMGGVCAVEEGATLTIEGPLQAPLGRIFTGPGKVVFARGAVEQVYPQWWGAQGNGQGDDVAAAQAAIDALPFGGVVRFPSGIYTFGAPLAFRSGITLEGPAELRSLKRLPAVLRSGNPAARCGGVMIRQLSVSGRGADGDRCAVGIDFTNTCSSYIENVGVSSCDIGINLDGPIFCGYNNLFRLSIGGCDIGIKLSNSTIKTALVASNIGAVKTGVLVATANELDVFGLSIEGFRSVGIDVLRGDTIHMHHLYFANGEESGTGIRIAKGVSSSTIVQPRFSRVQTPIDNQSPTTLVLASDFPTPRFKADALLTRGISAGHKAAVNLRGRVVVAEQAQQASVAFEKPEPDSDYFLVGTVTLLEGAPPPGANRVHIRNRTDRGFEAVLEDCPGKGGKVEINWILIR